MTTIILIIGLLVGNVTDYNQDKTPDKDTVTTTKVFDLNVNGG